MRLVMAEIIGAEPKNLIYCYTDFQIYTAISNIIILTL
jgi:hypothetical protein